MIAARVGFNAEQSFTWYIGGATVNNVPPGTTWFYYVDLTGIGFAGNYRAEFWEMDQRWTLVGRFSYGSWTALRFTNSEQGWEIFKPLPVALRADELALERCLRDRC